MTPTGSPSTKLIILRGNSASGKSTVAAEIRRRHGRGVAIVSQDMLRREILWVKGEALNPAIGLIDLTARYALDHDYHVIVEGIMGGGSHREMLTALANDHLGTTKSFYWDIPFEETVARHATKPQAAEYGAELMAQWFRDRDVVPALNETIFDKSLSHSDAVEAIMQEVGLPVREETGQ